MNDSSIPNGLGTLTRHTVVGSIPIEEIYEGCVL